MKIQAQRVSGLIRKEDGERRTEITPFVRPSGLLGGWCFHCNKSISLFPGAGWVHLNTMSSNCYRNKKNPASVAAFQATPYVYEIEEEW